MAQPTRPKIKLKTFAEHDQLLHPDGLGGHGKVAEAQQFYRTSDEMSVIRSGTWIWRDTNQHTSTHAPLWTTNPSIAIMTIVIP